MASFVIKKIWQVDGEDFLRAVIDVITVRHNQKRIETVIEQENVLDENGEVQLDQDGNPVKKDVEVQNEIIEDINVTYEQEVCNLPSDKTELLQKIASYAQQYETDLELLDGKISRETNLVSNVSNDQFTDIIGKELTVKSKEN